jgi:hypothetical protein
VVQDAFRRGIGHAVQWYDILQVRLDQQLEAAIVAADTAVDHLKAAPLMPSFDGLPLSNQVIHEVHPNGNAIHHSEETPLPPSISHEELTSHPNQSTHESNSGGDHPIPTPPPKECSRILQRRCPTCFALDEFGRPGQSYVTTLLHLVTLLITGRH